MHEFIRILPLLLIVVLFVWAFKVGIWLQRKALKGWSATQKLPLKLVRTQSFSDTCWGPNGTTTMSTDGFECEVIDGVVWVRFHGTISADVADRMLPAVMKVGAESRCRRFLYDIRQTSLSEAIIDLYRRPAQVEGLGMKHAARHAMLCAKVDEKAQFLETVSTNRGFQFRLFTDEEECLAWLKA